MLPCTMRQPIERKGLELQSYYESQEAKLREEALVTGKIWFDSPSIVAGWANGQLEAARAVDILQQVKENNHLPGEPAIIRLKAKTGEYPISAWNYRGLGHDYAAMELRWGEHDLDIPYGPTGVRIFACMRNNLGVGVSFTGDNWTRIYESEDYHNYRRLLATQRRIGDVRDLLLRKQIDFAMGLAAPDKYHGREPYTSWESIESSAIKAA